MSRLRWASIESQMGQTNYSSANSAIKVNMVISLYKHSRCYGMWLCCRLLPHCCCCCWWRCWWRERRGRWVDLARWTVTAGWHPSFSCQWNQFSSLKQAEVNTTCNNRSEWRQDLRQRATREYSRMNVKLPLDSPPYYFKARYGWHQGGLLAIEFEV